MSGRFVRASKYRHVFGRSTRKEQCYDNLHISKNAWDTNLVKANPEYLSVNWDSSGGGAFAVIPLNEKGRLPEKIPLFRGHTAVVLDTDWNPFNDSLIASGSDDGKVFLWRVPQGFSLYTEEGKEVQDVAPVGKLSGHPRKVGHVLFNPAAENVLASASGDFTVKLWDIEAGAAKLSLKLGDIVQSMSWSADGSMLVTTSRDKKLRIWDVRQERPAQETQGHPGAKNSRAVWMGELDRIATTGFSRMSDRQLALWDIRAVREPMGGFQRLDSISGVCMPFWDDGTKCLYLAGKGDGNIRYYEYENDKFEYLSEYKSSDPQRGLAFIPKRGVNIHENEVTRAFKTVNDNYIEPISFIVPRRAETFQDDIYPPTVGGKSAMSSGAWFEGQTALPPKIDLAGLYDGTGAKEVSPATPTTAPTFSSAPAPAPAKAPEPVKAPEPIPEPAPVKIHAPPPSMKEQGASMAAMASKFQDNDDKEEDDDDASSFEEVSKPTERPTHLKVDNKAVEQPLISPPHLWKTGAKEESKAQPETSAPAASKPETPSVTSPATSTSGNQFSPEALFHEIQSIKSLLSQQAWTIKMQTEQIDKLTSEVERMKQ